MIPYDVIKQEPCFVKKYCPVHIPVRIPVKIPVNIEVPCYQDYETVRHIRKDVY
jgi:hypothetical protein